jgi:hypothetical protein
VVSQPVQLFRDPLRLPSRQRALTRSDSNLHAAPNDRQEGMTGRSRERYHPTVVDRIKSPRAARGGEESMKAIRWPKRGFQPLALHPLH